MAFRAALGECSFGPFQASKGLWSRFFGERKVGVYLAAGAVIVVGTMKILSDIKKKNRRKKWNNVGKNKVVLHMVPRGRYCPSLSPFVVKLEMYLRMAQIPYEVDHEEPYGPKGKFPWITLNGEEIGDSQLIVDKLGVMFKKDFSGHLSLEQKAVSTSMRIMVDEFFLWCLILWRFIEDDFKAFIECVDQLPPSFHLYKCVFQRRLKKMCYMQGLGRHCTEDVVEFGRQTLESLSNWLGNKRYFMGDKATEVDCTVFGMLSQLEWNSPGSPYLPMIKGDYKNLSDYCHRIKDEFWPDWNKCLKPPQP